MALIIKKWFPCENERAVLEHVTNLYGDVERDVYLLHDVLLATKDGVNFRPDFIIIDPLYGISIIEEKSYLKKNLKEINRSLVIFRDGKSDVNPIKKGEDYRFNLKNLLASEGIELSTIAISCHVVFTKLPKNYIQESSAFVEKHYQDFEETLTFESLFTGFEVSQTTADKISAILSPVQCFYGLNEHTNEIAELDEEQLETVKQSTDGHFLVSGIPGSGKSVIIVSRALYLQELHPNWKILILSVNEKLKTKNQSQINSRTRIRENLGLKNKIVCQTLMSFLKENSKADVRNLSYGDKISQYISEISSREIKPEWDAILIDEYQDFEDACLKLIMSFAIKKEMVINKKDVIRENLFLVGDKLQQIWEKGCSHTWLSLGIHVSGRTKNLKTSYRCGKEALELGLDLLKSCSKTLEHQVNDFYLGTDDIEYNSELGCPVTFSSGFGEEAVFELQKWILGLISQGARYSEIIIIVPDSKKTLEKLESRFVREQALGLTIGMPSTIKGLEAPFCAVFNMDYIKPVEWNTKEVKFRTLYMCLTRASYGLFINSFVKNDEVFLKMQEIQKKIGKEKIA